MKFFNARILVNVLLVSVLSFFQTAAFFPKPNLALISLIVIFVSGAGFPEGIFLTFLAAAILWRGFGFGLETAVFAAVSVSALALARYLPGRKIFNVTALILAATAALHFISVFSAGRFLWEPARLLPELAVNVFLGILLYLLYGFKKI